MVPVCNTRVCKSKCKSFQLTAKHGHPHALSVRNRSRLIANTHRPLATDFSDTTLKVASDRSHRRTCGVDG